MHAPAPPPTMSALRAQAASESRFRGMPVLGQRRVSRCRASVICAGGQLATRVAASLTASAGTPSQKPPMKNNPTTGPGGRAAPRRGAARGRRGALDVLVGVRGLVRRDAERCHAALACDGCRQAQHVGRGVVMIGEEPGRELEADARQAVRVEHCPGELRAGQAGVVGDRPVAREHGAHVVLREDAAQQRQQEQQPDQREHGAIPPARAGVAVTGRSRRSDCPRRSSPARRLRR